MILPEAREMSIHECGDCRFYICVRGVTETRYGCVERVPKYRSLAHRAPSIIFVMGSDQTGGTGWSGDGAGEEQPDRASLRDVATRL
jgi:hypothetical protein